MASENSKRPAKKSGAFGFVNGRFAPLIFMVILLAAIYMAPFFVTHWDTSALKPELNNPVKSKLQLWLFWIVIQAVAWVVAVAYLVTTLVRLWDSFKRHLWNATLTLSVPAGVVVAALLRHSGTGLPPSNVGGFDISNLPHFGMWGVLLAVVSVWEMYLVRAVLIEEFSRGSSGSGKIRKFVLLREEVSRLLFIAAGILVMGTLSTAGLRTAVNAAAGSQLFPEAYVVLYGAINSVFLIVVYIPVQASFFTAGTMLRESLEKEPDGSPEGIRSWYDERKKLGEILGLNLSQLSALGAPLSTLLPFLSGWVSHLFKSG